MSMLSWYNITFELDFFLEQRDNSLFNLLNGYILIFLLINGKSYLLNMRSHI